MVRKGSIGIRYVPISYCKADLDLDRVTAGQSDNRDV